MKTFGVQSLLTEWSLTPLFNRQDSSQPVLTYFSSHIPTASPRNPIFSSEGPADFLRQVQVQTAMYAEGDSTQGVRIVGKVWGTGPSWTPRNDFQETKGAVISAASRKLALRFGLQDHIATAVYLTCEMSATGLAYHLHVRRDWTLRLQLPLLLKCLNSQTNHQS